jgi:hypothetical protein
MMNNLSVTQPTYLVLPAEIQAHLADIGMAVITQAYNQAVEGGKLANRELSLHLPAMIKLGFGTAVDQPYAPLTPGTTGQIINVMCLQIDGFYFCWP